MSASGLTIKHLVFTGPQVAPAQLKFDAGLNLLYGASNTGKSFTLKVSTVSDRGGESSVFGQIA